MTLILLMMRFSLMTVIISASNHMFGRAVWDELPECIFENLLINHTKPTSIAMLIIIKRVFEWAIFV